jgi:elongation factor G
MKVPAFNAMTSGAGRYITSLSHYEGVPPTVQQKLVAAHRVHDDD